MTLNLGLNQFNAILHLLTRMLFHLTLVYCNLFPALNFRFFKYTSKLQLASGKNVILLNTTAKHQNHPPGSVIQTVNASDTSNDANIQVSSIN